MLVAAVGGMEKLLVPVNAPVSNATLLTPPGVKSLAAASLVTECSVVPSSFTTVTVAPGGTRRSRGEKAMLRMVMKKPVVCCGGAGDEDDDDDPHAPSTAQATPTSTRPALMIPPKAGAPVRSADAFTLGPAPVRGMRPLGARRAGEAQGGAVVGTAAGSTVTVPSGVAIAPRWTEQKYGTTAPARASFRTLNVRTPVNGRVSNAMPATDP